MDVDGDGDATEDGDVDEVEAEDVVGGMGLLPSG